MGVKREQPDGIPTFIFGTPYSNFTVEKSRQILKNFQVKYRHKDKWPELLSKLDSLQRRTSRTETAAIRYWVVRTVSGISLEQILSQARAAPNTVFRGSNVNVGPDDDESTTETEAEAEETATKECGICTEDVGMDHFVNQKLSASCNHEPAICRTCLTQYFETQIPENAWDQITCPECPELLSFDVVKDWASPEAFERYQQKALVAAFKDMPDFTMCLGPGCDSGQIHVGGDDNPIMTCTICQFKTCFTHKMPWHTDQTCAEYDNERKERMEQEAASEKFIAEKAKICPNPQCGLPIIKHGGCDHMTCRHCKIEFCYKCRAFYKEINTRGNSAHELDCQ